jgi:hypothetical protein
MVSPKWRNAPVVLALVLGVFAVAAPRLDADEASGLFDAQTLQRLDIDLHSADWAKLRESFESNEYYPADVTWNGIKAYNVGVRSHGAASRNGAKPALKLDFNHYASGQTFVGMKSLVLDNLVQDPSGVHESTAMWFFARLGLPAPREAKAAVYVRGEYAGLYTIVEPVDKNMLARVFGNAESGNQNDGYLYEFNKAAEWWCNYLGPGIDAYKPFFEAKTHGSQDDDLTFLDPSYDLSSYQDANVLVKKLMEIPEYRALYLDTLSEAVRSALAPTAVPEVGALELEIRRELDVIDQAMLADAFRPYSDAEYIDAREFMKQFAPRRARYVECEVARVTGAARPCA